MIQVKSESERVELLASIPAIVIPTPSRLLETRGLIHPDCGVSFADFKMDVLCTILCRFLNELREEASADPAPPRLRLDGEEKKLGVVDDRPVERKADRFVFTGARDHQMDSVHRQDPGALGARPGFA